MWQLLDKAGSLQNSSTYQAKIKVSFHASLYSPVPRLDFSYVNVRTVVIKWGWSRYPIVVDCVQQVVMLYAEVVIKLCLQFSVK